MRMQNGFTTKSASNIDLFLAKHVTQKLNINSECIPDECFTDRWEIFLTTQLGLKYVSGTSSYSGVILGHLSLLPSDEIL